MNTSTNVRVLLPKYQQIWDLFTAPHSEIKEPQRQRQARLLSAFLFWIAVIGIGALITVFFVTGGYLPGSTTVMLLGITSMYVFSRTPHYWLASTLALIVMILGVFASAVLIDAGYTTFYIVVVLLSVLLVKSTVVRPIIGIVLVLSLLSFFVSGRAIGITQLIFVLVSISIPSILMLVYTSHRDQLEQERQAELRAANLALAESEALLDQRVRDRTLDLQIAGDVARQITTLLELEPLLQAIVKRTNDGFNLVNVSVFLYDQETSQLQETASALPTVSGRPLKVDATGHSSAAARAASSREAILDHQATVEGAAPSTELALPLLIGDALLGVLQLQSVQESRFNDEQRQAMTMLAEQIAIAVRNAQLFTEAQAARRRAEDADRVKSAFLASMSHELRTPLNAIINFTKFVAQGDLGPVTTEQADILQEVVASGKHLLNLINDVLDMSKIESGTLVLFVEDNINIVPLLETAVAMGKGLIADKAVQIDMKIGEALPLLRGDRQRLLQIIINLISNACKFTETGHICITAQQQQDKLVLAVEDTGSGIALEDQQSVFEAFKQTNNGLRQGGGTGLGLPITQNLVKAHGGAIWLESELGKGTTFYVKLPIQNEKLVVTLSGNLEL